MDWYASSLLVTTLLVSLVAGLVFTFALLVMPGIKTLSDLPYLETFKAIDRIIQNGHPLFMFVWLGSAVGLVITAALGWNQLGSLDRGILVGAVLLYGAGVMAPTAAINVPANNRVQSLDLPSLSPAQLHTERQRFEPRWRWWNTFRTIVALVTTVLLLLLLLRH